jgi:AraC-like DNA-binding protein
MAKSDAELSNALVQLNPEVGSGASDPLPGLVAPYVRNAGFAVRRRWRLGPRRLLDYLLVYVQEGILNLHLNGTDSQLGQGAFCLVQPDEIHSLEGIGDTVTPYVHFDVFLNARRRETFVTIPGDTDLSQFQELLQPRLNDLTGIAIPTVLAPRQPELLAATLLRLIRAWERTDVLSQLHANQLAMELVIQILSDHTEQTAEFGLPSRLDWVRSYMILHLNEDLRVTWLASRARLSASRFSALFAKRFGTPPHRYLTDLRIHKARQLLMDTNHSQAQIAGYCGFADTYHFSKVFKRRIGLSPREFKRSIRETMWPGPHLAMRSLEDEPSGPGPKVRRAPEVIHGRSNASSASSRITASHSPR